VGFSESDYCAHGSWIAGKTFLWMIHRNTAKLAGDISISAVPLASL
jgi:hypothetical protein